MHDPQAKVRQAVIKVWGANTAYWPESDRALIIDGLRKDLHDKDYCIRKASIVALGANVNYWSESEVWEVVEALKVILERGSGRSGIRQIVAVLGQIRFPSELAIRALETLAQIPHYGSQILKEQSRRYIYLLPTPPESGPAPPTLSSLLSGQAQRREGASASVSSPPALFGGLARRATRRADVREAAVELGAGASAAARAGGGR